ncbi:MAG TPA: carboxypeptidase-like regulatory domain-containing protein, partial [Candidatus Sulfopaludibacter sp.]|nr:carboxypeptidase-like regulatory domain-containing protein [Candidatus Sulfopaludibacter sp.]
DATGKPVANAAIWLIREERWCMPPECHPDHRQSKSGENGEFAVNDLTPGPWLVAATAPPSWGAPASRGDERLGWAQTFYPGVIDPRLAEAVLLQPGSEQWNTDIRLTAAPLHRLLGRVLDPRGDPAPKASVTLGKGFGPALTEEANADGAFEFAVVDDQWSVSAALDRNVVKLRSTRTVDLRGRDSEDIEMRLSAPFTLQGKIVMEVPDGMPAPEPPPIDIGLVPNVPMLSDGPGDFLDIRTGDDSLTSLKRIVSGSRCLSGRLPGAVSHRLAGSVLSRLHPPGRTRRRGIIPGRFGESVGGGTVRGTLDGCETHHVFLVPQEAVLRRDGFIRIATCDRNGRFEFPAVRPGEYYGIAMAKEPRSFADLSDDRVLSQGSKVTVRANESTSADLQLSRR